MATSFFRVRGKAFLITWAQCDADHVTIFDLLCTLGEPARAIIARERHEDGAFHMHAYVEFPTNVDRRVRDSLHALGRHPNIGPKRTARERTSAAEYVRKGDDWIEYGDWTPEDGGVTESLCDLIRACNGFGDMLDLAHRRGIQFGLAKAAWDHINNPSVPTYLTGDEYPGVVRSEALRNLRWDDFDQEKVLIVCGPTSSGKTSWAIHQMPRPSVLVSTVDDLRGIREGFHKSIIFDDVSFMGDPFTGKGRYPRNTMIHLTDHHVTRSVHLRHRNCTIPAGMYKCFTCNPGHIPVDLDDPAIARRCTLFEFTEIDIGSP